MMIMMIMMTTTTTTNFGLSDLKKDNTWFTLKSCSCAQNSSQEAFQTHCISFGKLGGYKGLYCIKYYERHSKRKWFLSSTLIDSHRWQTLFVYGVLGIDQRLVLLWSSWEFAIILAILIFFHELVTTKRYL